MESWKAVKHYESLYEVSNLGRVRTAKGHRILKPWRTRNGYIHITLTKDKAHKHMLMHRVVATAFCERGAGCDVVNHINRNPSDNRAVNLEWTTQSRNVKYAYDMGRADNVARKKIKCVENGKQFYSSMEAATWLNIERFHDSHNLNTISRTIRQAANGSRGHKTAYGLHWVFCE